MNGKIFLEPFGGLGNRMRAIVSAARLAQILQKDLKIIWKTGDDFNCTYNNLFKPNKLLEIFNEKSLHGIYSSFNRSRLRRVAIRFLNQLKGIDLAIWEQDHKQTFFRTGFDPATLNAYPNIFIRSCEQFYGGDEWNLLQPLDILQSKIDSIVRKFNHNTIGVHIRRKDNGKSILHSPLNIFIDMMANEIKKDPNVIFFIATDDPMTLDKLSDVFKGTKLIIYDKEYSRSEEQGIQDALVELYCLSNCKKIIGSYWSSFTDVAGMLKQAELVVAKQPDSE